MFFSRLPAQYQWHHVSAREVPVLWGVCITTWEPAWVRTDCHLWHTCISTMTCQWTLIKLWKFLPTNILARCSWKTSSMITKFDLWHSVIHFEDCCFCYYKWMMLFLTQIVVLWYQNIMCYMYLLYFYTYLNLPYFYYYNILYKSISEQGHISCNYHRTLVSFDSNFFLTIEYLTGFFHLCVLSNCFSGYLVSIVVLFFFWESWF